MVMQKDLLILWSRIGIQQLTTSSDEFTMHGVNYRNMNLKRADTLDADRPFDEKRRCSGPL